MNASLLCPRRPADRQILEWLMVRIKRHRCGQLSSRSLMRAARVSHPALRGSLRTVAADEAVGSAPGNHHTCMEVIRWRLLRVGLITELEDVECDWQWNVDSVIRGDGSWLLFLKLQRCRACRCCKYVEASVLAESVIYDTAWRVPSVCLSDEFCSKTSKNRLNDIIFTE